MWKEALMLLGIGGLIGGWIGYGMGRRKAQKEAGERIERMIDESGAILTKYDQLLVETRAAKRKEEGEDAAKKAAEIARNHRYTLEEALKKMEETARRCMSGEAEEALKKMEEIARGCASGEAETEPEDEFPAEPDEPYLVESTAFAPHDCDFETLTYYADDDILVDMYGDPVENLETLIGRAGIDHLESMPADECGSFYIRNPDIDIVYEVEIIRGISYGGD